MSVLNNSNAISTGGAYNLESSLRFRSSASAYLSWTPASAGNRRTWTWSGWVKRGSLTGNQALFTAETSTAGSGTYSLIRFVAGQLVYFDYTNGTTNHQSVCTGEFRDPSAWYHIVVAVDTTQATASNRVKIYVNGVQQSTTSSATFTQNYQGQVNNALLHYIGTAQIGTSNQYFDGYMTEINLVDGQALTPSDFGETDTTTGVWKPKEYTGTYGTNGFYLPMKETQQATGFNTVLWTGNSGTQSITGVGFSPDLVWIKDRSAARDHRLFDTIRGATKELYPNLSDTEFTQVNSLTSFNNDGFSVGSTTAVNLSAETFVAWCWDAGSSTVSNTDGTITSSVRANPATGFSIVTWSGNGSAGATIGHGLGAVPKMIIAKSRTNGSDWWDTYHESLGNSNAVFLNSTYESVARTYWNNTTPTSSVITLGSDRSINGSGETFVAYCFSEIAGYSKFGSYTGNGSTSGPTVTLGFRPAFVMVKRTDVADEWAMHDNTRDPDNKVNLRLRADSSGAELTTQNIDFNDNGFQVTSTSASHNASGGTYIYMAFADTRDAQFNFDASGNKNNWTANNINSNASSETTYDIMNDVATLTDEDTANFCTLNPLDKGSVFTLANANISATSVSTGYGLVRGTIGVSSGKWYWENTIVSGSASDEVGICTATSSLSNYIGSSATGWSYYSNGTKITNNTNTAYGASYTTNDVIGVAFDADAGTLTFYKNNVSQGTAFTGLTGQVYFPAIGDGSNSAGVNMAINFGQRPFKYTPPTGYKKLNTYNLPDSTIKDGSQYFITNTFTGTGSTLSINTGFSPDFVWLKSRSFADHPLIYDSIRGANQRLYSSLTNAESTATNQLNSFDSDGYTLGSDPSGQINVSGQTSVGWSWRGSDSSAVSNTDGTITSTVSANTTSGFSIVTYTGTGALATVGHGLGTIPKVVISKCRSSGTASDGWVTYHASLGNTGGLVLNLTNGFITDNGWFNSTSPTSSVFTRGSSSSVNSSGQTYVAYCFADVEGFSKFGSYTGNGSTDGPFVYTGFRPAFVMIKNASAANSWYISDSAREPENVVDYALYPNLSDAESSPTNYDQDFLSNGFKIRNTGTYFNTNGNTYIYMAFAENPLKHSLAR